MTTRYVWWSELFDYCRRSAHPIGRLVLRIAGHRDEGSMDLRLQPCIMRFALPREAIEGVSAAGARFVPRGRECGVPDRQLSP